MGVWFYKKVDNVVIGTKDIFRCINKRRKVN